MEFSFLIFNKIFHSRDINFFCLFDEPYTPKFMTSPYIAVSWFQAIHNSQNNKNFDGNCEKLHPYKNKLL